MTYQETLEYLYKQLPMFSRTGAAAYKKDIHNTVRLCEALGNPHHSFKSVHVAGTNGKGSTCHMLAAVFQLSDYKTGLYTSPHISDFGERIRINGEMISHQFVIDFAERTKDLCEEIKPSFFELTVAMAFTWFAEQKIDIAIIETGLGGRLDSTNVITPFLSVITNVGYDHMDLLGNTIQEIASEKAGIIKKNIPVIIGETLPETRDIFISTANEKDAPIRFAEDDLIIEYIDPSATMLLCNIKDIETGVVEKLTLDLPGLYQCYNSRTVLCCIKEIRKLGYSIPPETVHEALSHVRKITGLRGRWEVLQSQPMVIADAAHNKDGIARVIEQLSANYNGAGWHFIMGFVNDKDINGILSILPKDAKYYFTNAHQPRALAHHELNALALSHELNGSSYDDINDAIDAAKKNASKEDVIMICGSFYILGEIRSF